MKLYQRFFILGSNIFTLFCFSLPWMNGYSGLAYTQYDEDGIIFIIFIISLIITGFILFWCTRILILVITYLGLFILLIFLFVNLDNIEYGLLLTVAGYILTIAGVRFFPKNRE